MVTNSAELPFAPGRGAAPLRHEPGWYAGRWGAGTAATTSRASSATGTPQLDLAWIVGLLLRGWRKGADTANGVTLGSGVAAGDDLAWWAERAVEAAGRRL